MIDVNEFIGQISNAGIDFWTGVPCSFLNPLINGVTGNTQLKYIAATSEGEAVAIACGAWLAGKSPLMMCQNSGLGNAVNPLTSLSFTFKIPLTIMTTWRGQPGIKDEPQHELMGRITMSLLELCNIKTQRFPSDLNSLRAALSIVTEYTIDKRQSIAFLIEQGSLANEEYSGEPVGAKQNGELIKLANDRSINCTRIEALESLLSILPDDLPILTTTGKTSRELFTLQDHEKHFYQIGSMGCCNAIGLGVAVNYAKKVIVVDGDGALLMKMGNVATIGSYSPDNLIHILLDNAVHDSTGGQHTVSSSISFSEIAAACSYKYVYELNKLDDFERVIKQCLNYTGPTFIHLHIKPGSIKSLGRPTISPPEIAARFRAFLTK